MRVCLFFSVRPPCTPCLRVKPRELRDLRDSPCPGANVESSMRLIVGTLVISFALFAPVFTQQSPALPTPESSLGFKPGDDYKLATYDEAIDYFRKLDAASDRLTLVESGRTSVRPSVLFRAVSSPENLATSRVPPDRPAARPSRRTVGRRGAPARAGGQGVRAHRRRPALERGGRRPARPAARLRPGRASRRPGHQADPRQRRPLLWPTINPDGQNIVSRWYMGNVGTPFETAPLTELYQKYVGHDNNRDAYMLNMVESRELARRGATGSRRSSTSTTSRRRFRRASGCRRRAGGMAHMEAVFILHHSTYFIFRHGWFFKKRKACQFHTRDKDQSDLLIS